MFFPTFSLEEKLNIVKEKNFSTFSTYTTFSLLSRKKIKNEKLLIFKVLPSAIEIFSYHSFFFGNFTYLFQIFEFYALLTLWDMFIIPSIHVLSSKFYYFIIIISLFQ